MIREHLTCAGLSLCVLLVMIAVVGLMAAALTASRVPTFGSADEEPVPPHDGSEIEHAPTTKIRVPTLDELDHDGTGPLDS